MKTKLACLVAYVALFFGCVCLSFGGCLLLNELVNPIGIFSKPFDDGVNWDGGQNTPETSRDGLSTLIDDGHWKD